METLPKDVLEHVFVTLNARDLLHAAWTCTSWRRALWYDEDWWHAYHDKRWPRHAPSTGRGVSESGSPQAATSSHWQQTCLTHGLHRPWRYKPMHTDRLHHHVERQGGWNRRSSSPAVLVEGDWALLTCTPRQLGPSGGRDRLQLLHLKRHAPQPSLPGDWALGPAKEHWLDFGANKYKPYAIHAGATDLHMPFVAQGRASAVFVWKADQQHPMALLEQGEGVEVPAVAIERTPWGQQPHADSIRLASCTSTAKVFVWSTAVGCQPSEALWSGSATDVCDQFRGWNHVGALALWSLSKPCADVQSPCFLAIGTDQGVALLYLSSPSPSSVAFTVQALRVTPHDTPVIRCCVSFDYTSPVCPHPSDLSQLSSEHQCNLSDTTMSATVDWALDPLQHSGVIQAARALVAEGEAERAAGRRRAAAEATAAAAARHAASVVQGELAPACDRAYLSVIWGPQSPDEDQDGRLSIPLRHRATVSAVRTSKDWLGQSIASHNAASGTLHIPQGQGIQCGPDVPGPDDLVASLRRLRPHVHAAGPFDGTSRTDFLAKSWTSKAAPAAQSEQPINAIASAAGTSAHPSADAAADGIAADLPQLANTAAADDDVAESPQPADAAAAAAADDDDVAAQSPQLADAAYLSSTPSDRTSAAVPSTIDNPDLNTMSRPAAAQADHADSAADHSHGGQASQSVSAPQHAPAGAEQSAPAQSGYSATQLDVLSHTCSTVACIEVLCPSATPIQVAPSNPDHIVSCAGPDQHASHQALQSSAGPQDVRCPTADAAPSTSDNAESSDTEARVMPDASNPTPLGSPSTHQTHDGCEWSVQMKWAEAIVGAAHLSAGEGAVAVACTDGMLLLLDLATGKLLRRVPNQHLDRRFMERYRRSTAFAHLDTPWLHPTPVLNCTVWWGRNTSLNVTAASHMSLTAVTEMIQQSEGLHHLSSKELSFEQYTCAEEDLPCCLCTHGGKARKAQLRTTKSHSREMPDSEQWAQQTTLTEQQTTRAVQNLLKGVVPPLSGLCDLGIQLQHQHLARLYFTCNRQPTRHNIKSGCRFVTFFD